MEWAYNGLSSREPPESWLVLPFPFTNFTAGLRKWSLIPFNYFSPGDNITWIQSPNFGPLSIAQPVLTGTLDGNNAVFTVPGIFNTLLQIQRNGVTQLLGTMYTLSGATVTFLDPYVPQPGDYLQALVA
jgi:hypothetical protein